MKLSKEEKKSNKEMRKLNKKHCKEFEKEIKKYDISQFKGFGYSTDDTDGISHTSGTVTECGYSYAIGFETGYIKQLKKQKAIECLKEIRQDVLVDNCEDYSVDLNYLVELIDNKIKELED